ATVPNHTTPESIGARPSTSSAPSASVPKYNVINGLAALPLKMVANDADGRAVGSGPDDASTVRAHPLKTNAGNAADAAVAQRPGQSATEITGAPGWRARL